MAWPDSGMPPLVDRDYPVGATFGNQPDFSAFPGVQQQQNVPSWASGQGGFAANQDPWGRASEDTWARMPTSGDPWGRAPASASGWTYGQYQPSPASWINNNSPSPWSAPPAGRTPNWPSSGGVSPAWPPGERFEQPSPWSAGSSDQPITGGGFGAQNAGHTPAWSAARVWDDVEDDDEPWLTSATARVNTYPDLTRSVSQRQRNVMGTVRPASRGRSKSFSGSSPWAATTPLWGVAGGRGNDTFDQNNLARRPRDWRADYFPRPGLMSMLSVKGRSDVKEITDSVRRTLHPLLVYSLISPSIEYDLRGHPLVPNTLRFPSLHRIHNNIDLAQLATNPPTDFMRICHPRFPWYIDIRQTHVNGVTILDVVTQIFEQMYTPITGRHFWNDELSEIERAAISAAFQQRCGGQQEQIARGVVRLDFLGIDGNKFIWVGLVKGKNGMWEMKTKKR